MRPTPGPVLEEVESPAPELRLLIPTDPWPRVFVQNVLGLLERKATPLELESAPADFWSDVFVEPSLPWGRFFQSGGCHILALMLVWAGARFLALQPHATLQPRFTPADVIYYTPSEYLPPLDTRQPTSEHAQKADPELSAQPIISLPPEADNRSQTIVTAPNIRLQHDVPLPNTVAWSNTPRMPIAPAPLVPASEISRLTPQMERSVIAPPPVFQDTASQKTLRAPEAAVIAPPPALDTASRLRAGELNIGRSTVIAPAPQLSVDEQRIVPGRPAALRGHSSQVIAPPPSVGAAGVSRSAGGMIALSLRPAVGAPPTAVAGNRRGSFATTPEGHHGASGAAGASASGASTTNGNAGGSETAGKLPSGLYVGKTSNATSAVAGDPSSSSGNLVNPNLIASARPPRISRTPTEGDPKISEAERAVFGGRKVYSLSLNMPNLNSGGGSWIIHFAALKADSTPANPSGETADLSSPVATRKVDPAYPLELMRQNVSGTVILHAVILADGTVGTVRVLRSVDDRLDQFASDAIAKWQFQPAMKNGSPVAVEATFWIPFRPTRTRTDF
ncbi:MAG: TonB family protein [Candidatus Sulfotelmatobacter sp.]